MKTSLILLAATFTLLFCMPGLCYGQSTNLNDYLKMPAVVPSSPNAASIEKFGNIPVDYSTGVPSISIPIWTVKCGPISWPFSFSYHAGGIKVDEISSSVGLGWALIGPGVISRSVLGKPDEQFPGNPLYTSVSYSDYNYLYAVRNGQNDAESDIFTYNFNGRSGKFLIKQDGSIFMMPYNNLKIINNAFNSFSIIDETGTTYLFDQKENVSSDANGSLSSYTSSWYLSRVQPLNKAQSIDFVYGNLGTSLQSFYNFSQSIGVKPVPPATGCGAPEYVESFSTPTFGRTNNTTNTFQLTQVNFPNGYLIFSYTNDRIDIDGTQKGRLSSISIFQEGAATLVKNFNLTQSYFFASPFNSGSTDPKQYRLKLDKIEEMSKDLSISKPYKFEYNAVPMVPRGSYGQDKWGFNNGHYENTSLIQSQMVNFLNGNVYNVGSANRITDISLMQSCILNAITYPTGGKTVFSFEPHQYATNYSSTTPASYTAYASGNSPQTAFVNFSYPAASAINPRIKVDLSKYNYSGVTDRPYVKLTDLTTGTVVYNLSNFTPDNLVQSDNTFLLSPGHSYKAEAFVFTSVTNTQLEARIIVQWELMNGGVVLENGAGLRVKEIKNYASDNLVATDEIYEYSLGAPLTPFSYVDKNFNDVIYRVGIPACAGSGGACLYSQSGTCRIFHSASMYPVSTVGGAPLLYSRVTKYIKDVSGNGNDLGKTEYLYDIVEDAEIPVGGSSLFNAHLHTNDWKNAFLQSEIIYKNTGGAYQVVKRTDNEYAEYKKGIAYSLKVYPNYVQAGCELQGPSNVTNDVNFFSFPIYSGSKKLKKTAVTDIDGNGNQIITTTVNEYTGSTNDFLSKTTTTDSKGIDRTSILKYPADFSATGNVFDKMIQQNFVSPVIDHQTYAGSSLVSTTHTIYKDWNSDSKVLAPEFMQSSILTNSLENRVQYYNYGVLGKPLSLAKTNDATVSYIYDYKGELAVAEGKNANLNDIAFTSFESDGSGNWTIPAGGINVASGVTGAKSYNLTNGQIQKAGLTVGVKYILAFWAQAGTRTIAGGSAVLKTGRTVGAWTYYEYTVTATAPAISISGTGLIDELRLYPAAAQMTSYTYDPLIGQTSVTDPNGEIVYYEYDNLNRLKNIKDYQGNIVKNFQYNYANSCGPNCVVMPMQTFNGSNTISYPVGVFNVSGQLIGQAATQAQYISLWNGNMANQAIGGLSAAVDSMHFNLTLNAGKTAPTSVTGLRFYQVDLAFNKLDNISNNNGVYVDFGDGSGMRLGKTIYDTVVTRDPKTDMVFFTGLYNDNNVPHFIHNYNDSSLKTLTFYHNDASTHSYFDNLAKPGTSLTYLSNLRGNLPQFIWILGGSGYQQAGMNSVAKITNWSAINSIVNFSPHNGDGTNPSKNLTYSQDFMSNNKGLKSIQTGVYGPYRTGYRDLSFKISRLKTDWNTFFTELETLQISEDHWNHEDLSGLKKLKLFTLIATTQSHTDLLNDPLIPLSSTVIDNVIIQVANGAGNAGVTDGTISFITGGGTRTASSNTALNQLNAAGWKIYLDGVLQAQ